MRSAWELLQKVKMMGTQARLKADAPGQMQRFEAFAAQIEPKYRAIAKAPVGPFVNPTWAGFNAKLEQSLLPVPSGAFLRDPTIQQTMFVDVRGPWLEEEIRYLDEQLTREELHRLVKEDHVGRPPLVDRDLLTSHNSIHHLYHLVRYARETGVDLASVGSVVEWGGGYGNMAKILMRMHPGSPTYVMIDTPLLSCLQWAYLGAILGEDRVKLLESATDPVVPGRVNLLPVSFLEGRDLRGELFVSTWALSESARHAQEYVSERGFFGARRLLLACQADEKNFPDASRAGKLAQARGAKLIDISFLPGNQYAFL